MHVVQVLAMRFLNSELNLEKFFQRLRRADARILLLDFDGTLAPFGSDRRDVRVYPGVADRLRSILEAPRSNVVLVSGRPALDLVTRLPLPAGLAIWGSHGIERVRDGGRLEGLELPRATRAALDDEAARIEARGWGERLERKPYGIAVHWRGLNAEAAALIETEIAGRWARLRPPGFELHPFDEGLELRVGGRDKGDAVRAVLAESGGEVAAAYLGDDLTDEDAFRAIQGKGLGVLVRRALRETAADLWLEPPDELHAFLERWQESLWA